MKPFTVIGYYESNGQTFARHVEAAYPSQAYSAAAHQLPDDALDPDDVVFVVAMPGHLRESSELFFPGEGVVDAYTVLDQPEVFA